MTPRGTRGRSGITLTEILISILIMGVGMISLATLFPLGLVRIRAAQRSVRSTNLTQSAQGDVGAQNLLNPTTFYPYVSPWFGTGNTVYPLVDPWIQDTTLPNVANLYGAGGSTVFNHVIPAGAYRGWGFDGLPQDFASGHPSQPYIPGPGLTVCYDPLWWSLYGARPNGAGIPEARFASGVGFVRADPDGQPASAHGLQRITNFDPLNPGLSAAQNALVQSYVAKLFGSIDDVVFQTEGATNRGPGFGAGVVPDLSIAGGYSSYDLTYSWLFTGRRTDVGTPTVYDGDIVVFQNRPFGFDAVPSPLDVTQTTRMATGETVVEAIFGYGASISPSPVGYANGDGRTVLLRWPTGQPDPEVKVGSWIADVTYETSSALSIGDPLDATPYSTGRFSRQVLGGNVVDAEPAQRCNWYRVSRRNTPTADPGFTNDPSGVSYRRMTLTLAQPVKTRTLLTNSSASVGQPVQPVHVNAALVSPYVVNVFSKTLYAR